MSTGFSTNHPSPQDATNNAIRPLSADAVHHIRTGQVIFDLTSAVKELVDNALDAGGTRINVRLFDGGLELIEVSDDGTGVPAADRPRLAVPHATSKLTRWRDLYESSSSEPRRCLGFRGEALYGLAALCENLVVLTRTPDEPLARRCEYGRDGRMRNDDLNGNVNALAPRKVGTTVAAVRFLAPHPVRRTDWQRRDGVATQRRRVVQLLRGYAVARPSVAFRLFAYDTTTATSSRQPQRRTRETSLLETPGGPSTTVTQTLSALYGSAVVDAIMPITIDLSAVVREDDEEEEEKKPSAAAAEEEEKDPSPWKITGYLSKPGVTVPRGVTPVQHFALNGRPVDLPKVTRLLQDLWRRTAANGNTAVAASKPSVIWDLTLPNHVVDVNAAVDKREVHFTRETVLLETVERAVRRRFWNADEGHVMPKAALVIGKSVAFANVHEEEDDEEEEDNDDDRDRDVRDDPDNTNTTPRFNRRYAFARDVSRIRLQHDFDDGRKRHYSGVHMTAAAARAVAELGDLANEDDDVDDHDSYDDDAAPRRPALLDMQQAAALAAAERAQSQQAAAAAAAAASDDDRKPSGKATVQDDVIDYGYDEAVPDTSGISATEAAARAAAAELQRDLHESDEEEQEELQTRKRPLDLAAAAAQAAAELEDDDDDSSVDLPRAPFKRERPSPVVSVTDTEEPPHGTPSPTGTGNPTLTPQLVHVQQQRRQRHVVPEAEQRLWRHAQRKFNAVSATSLSDVDDDQQADDENDDDEEDEGEEVTRDRRRVFLEQFQSSSSSSDRKKLPDRRQCLERYGFRSESMLIRREKAVTPSPPAAATAVQPPPPKRRAVSLPIKEGREELTATNLDDHHNAQKVCWEGFGSAQQVTEAALAERMRMRERKRALQETARDVDRDDHKIVKLHRGDFANLEIIGQFNMGFIIAKTRDNHLYILDQHACDEKYNFEKLCRETVIHEQRLIAPMPLELSPIEEACVLEHTDIFEKNGFRFQYDATRPPRHRFALVGLPHSGASDGRKAVQFGKDDVSALCSVLSGDETHEEMSGGGTGADGSGMYGNNAVRRYAGRGGSGDSADRVIARLPKAIAMFASRACRSSIMIGKALSNQEMDRIVKKLEHVQHPWNCPHGRPTMRHLGDLTTVLAEDERNAAEAIGHATVTVMTQDDA